MSDDVKADIKELYQRTETNAKEIAVNIQRTLSHEKECVLFRTQINKNIEEIKTDGKSFKRWVISLLSAVLLICIGIILRG